MQQRSLARTELNWRSCSYMICISFTKLSGLLELQNNLKDDLKRKNSVVQLRKSPYYVTDKY